VRDSAAEAFDGREPVKTAAEVARKDVSAVRREVMADRLELSGTPFAMDIRVEIP
jgi:hypothetical protein